jgi:K+-transporting ATPase KdpF subunit
MARRGWGAPGDVNPPILSAFLAGEGQRLAPPKFTRRHGDRMIGCMSIELIIAGVLGVFLLVYLVYSIVRPDKF